MERLIAQARPGRTQSNPLPDAVFAYNDAAALAAMRVCLARGLRVPQDIAIIGFDDIPAAAQSTPPLSTMTVDKEALGRRGVELLLEDSPNTLDPADTLVPVHLIASRQYFGRKRHELDRLNRRNSAHSEPADGADRSGAAASRSTSAAATFCSRTCSDTLRFLRAERARSERRLLPLLHATTVRSTTAPRATWSAVAASSSTTRWRTASSATRASGVRAPRLADSCATPTGTPRTKATTGKSNGATARSARSTRTRHCYGLAFVLLAYAHAAMAGIEEAKPMIGETFDLMEHRFWDAAAGLYADEATPDWRVSSYRGQNANMHTTEALLAALRGDRPLVYLDRAEKRGVEHHAASGEAVAGSGVGAFPRGLVGRLALQRGRQFEHLPPVGLPARPSDGVGEAAADSRASSARCRGCCRAPSNCSTPP